MAKVKEIKDLACDDCNSIIYTCDGCKNYFHKDDDVICQESDTEQKHYCKDCGGV